MSQKGIRAGMVNTRSNPARHRSQQNTVAVHGPVGRAPDYIYLRCMCTLSIKRTFRLKTATPSHKTKQEVLTGLPNIATIRATTLITASHGITLIIACTVPAITPRQRLLAVHQDIYICRSRVLVRFGASSHLAENAVTGILRVDFMAYWI